MKKEKKIRLLKAMTNVFQQWGGDEAWYYEWVTFGPPDGATDDDYEDIVSDRDYFEETLELFIELAMGLD